ncbi:class I SAM-dependent methyltransferase [Aliiroseovarius sp. YM-037]|uniref:class I SAM-dependent methyltransferase n=1 Tax=Aliiroseovarius sp. YM-037 TaxID=3341728 RepID=UPI003A806161
MTALLPHLLARIAQDGPLTVADYMADCLLHPDHGYYATRDPFGADGDFTTAPEISQMFGEVLGLCLAQTWQDQGALTSFTLAELGPGRGTLMADILRATARVPGFHTAARVHLVEASDTLKRVQRETLSANDVTWCDTVADLPNAPLFLVANEFFDALPIRQFIRAGDGWRERLVGAEGNALSFGTSAAMPVDALSDRLGDTAEGDLVETCAPALAIMSDVADRIHRFGGAALIIDYGDWKSLGDTLQAVKGHAYDPVLAHPGEADLTAHVDFEALAGAAAPLSTSRMTPQGVLLERLGITARAQQLAKILTGDALENHIAAHRRLTHPEEMGTLFKAIAVHPDGTPTPPGFDP